MLDLQEPISFPAMCTISSQCIVFLVTVVPVLHHVSSGLLYQVCGRADVWGDGVVPEPSALLPGATHLILEGVYHSPVGANEERPWYGSEPILSKWVDHLHE